MKVKTRYYNSYSTEDIEDLYMPKMLETYKLKIAIEKERKGKGYDSQSTGFSRASSNQSPMHLSTEHIQHNTDDLNLHSPLITTQPPVQIKSHNSSSIATPLSPASAFRSNTDNLFRQIIQERLTEFDQRMANEISSSTRISQKLFKQRIKKPINSNVEEESEEEEAVSTDHDQDDSLEISTSESDDLNMNEEEMQNFDYTKTRPKIFIKDQNSKQNVLSKSKIESAINKSLTLRNPGELISDFYISNMNYAMRYSVEYIQQVARDMRRRIEQQDSSLFPRLQRSFSVDRLYAVRREHIRYSNGADAYWRKNISFTTDDIQDIYMPWALDNYKRKIAVELERRRRFTDLNYNTNILDQDGDISPIRHDVPYPPVVLDDLDIFIIKKSKTSVEKILSQLTKP